MTIKKRLTAIKEAVGGFITLLLIIPVMACVVAIGGLVLIIGLLAVLSPLLIPILIVVCLLKYLF